MRLLSIHARDLSRLEAYPQQNAKQLPLRLLTGDSEKRLTISVCPCSWAVGRTETCRSCPRAIEKTRLSRWMNWTTLNWPSCARSATSWWTFDWQTAESWNCKDLGKVAKGKYGTALIRFSLRRSPTRRRLTQANLHRRGKRGSGKPCTLRKSVWLVRRRRNWPKPSWVDQCRTN